MDRRDFMRMASWAGLTCVLPSVMDPLRSSAQPISGSAYTGTYWIFMHAGGGWDPTHLCDPKGRATDNENNLNATIALYLYGRSFFLAEPTGAVRCIDAGWRRPDVLNPDSAARGDFQS